MTRKEKAIDIICDGLGVKPQDVTMESNLVELGMDSLDMIGIMFKLEEEFEIERLDLEFRETELRTVGQIIDVIEKNGNV